MRVFMAGIGHGISDKGIAAARDFLEGALQAEVPEAPKDFLVLTVR